MPRELPANVVDNKAMVFTFGRNGFFGYASGSPASANNLMWWSTFETDSLPSTTNLDVGEIKARMQERHQNWSDPVIQDIVTRAEVESIYPTWVLPPLPRWGEDRLVLLGDAAHALSPTTGQGASQALEDAQTWSLLLAELLKKAYNGEKASEGADVKTGAPFSEKDALDLAMKLFYEIRQPRVTEISDRGKKLDGNKADVGIIGEYFMYFFLIILNKYPAIGELKSRAKVESYTANVTSQARNYSGM